MSADLDEMFQALSQDADALPLSGAGDARRRGLRRTRTRAAVVAAAAVVVTAVGVGVAAHGPRPHAAPPATSPSPGLPEAGSADMGRGGVSYAVTAQDGKRAYTAWTRADDHSSWLIAADLSTGGPAWRARQITEPGNGLEKVVALPSVVLVVASTGAGPKPATQLSTFDSSTGEPLWTGQVPADESAVFTDRMLVRSSRLLGMVRGVDWRSGLTEWTVPLVQDRPLRTLGMTVEEDEERIDRAGPRADFTDGRVVVVTVGGQVQVRNAVTGELEHTTSVPGTSGSTMIAYEGRLFSHDEADENGGPHHIRATDLTGRTGSAIVQTVPDQFITLAGCGPNRVCVVTQNDTPLPHTIVTAIDTARHTRIWRAPTRYGGYQLSSAHGYVLATAEDGGYELFDPAGKSVFDATVSTGWLDAGTLLVHAPDGTNRLSRWSTADRKLTPLAAPPLTSGNCASTSELLICPAPGNSPKTDFLKIWRVG